MSSHDPREIGGGILERPKSKIAIGGHIGNVTLKEMAIETSVIPFFLRHVAW